jgi:hypothetical protein
MTGEELISLVVRVRQSSEPSLVLNAYTSPSWLAVKDLLL